MSACVIDRSRALDVGGLGRWGVLLRVRLRVGLRLRLGVGLRVGLGLRLLRRRRVRLLLGRLAGRAAAVVLVEARALEGDADVSEDLAQRAATVRALGQRVVGERLDDLELFAALLAAVLV